MESRQRHGVHRAAAEPHDHQDEQHQPDGGGVAPAPHGVDQLRPLARQEDERGHQEGAQVADQDPGRQPARARCRAASCPPPPWRRRARPWRGRAPCRARSPARSGGRRSRRRSRACRCSRRRRTRGTARASPGAPADAQRISGKHSQARIALSPLGTPKRSMRIPSGVRSSGVPSTRKSETTAHHPAAPGGERAPSAAGSWSSASGTVNASVSTSPSTSQDHSERRSRELSRQQGERLARRGRSAPRVSGRRPTRPYWTARQVIVFRTPLDCTRSTTRRPMPAMSVGLHLGDDVVLAR